MGTVMQEATATGKPCERSGAELCKALAQLIKGYQRTSRLCDVSDLTGIGVGRLHAIAGGAPLVPYECVKILIGLEMNVKDLCT